MHTYIFVRMHMCKYIWYIYIYTCMRAHARARTHTHRERVNEWVSEWVSESGKGREGGREREREWVSESGKGRKGERERERENTYVCICIYIIQKEKCNWLKDINKKRNHVKWIININDVCVYTWVLVCVCIYTYIIHTCTHARAQHTYTRANI